MAGTLTISTLSDGTNSTSSTNCIQGSAKAWVNFNGSPTSGSATIRAAYNVSSVTINGTGEYAINFTNAFADTNYTPVATGSFIYGTAWSIMGINSVAPSTESAPTTTSMRLFTSGNFSVGNPKYISVAIFR